MNHTFAICAYKESEYLEECICSLLAQTVKTNIIIATSTPNAYISELAQKYEIPLYINEGESGITQDWNFALSKVTTKYATIAHQDDLYEPKYGEALLSEMMSEKNVIMGFTDYYEVRNGEKVYDTTILKIKRILLAPLKVKAFRKSIFVRRRSLSFGDGICCPSVCFCLDNIERPIFNKISNGRLFPSKVLRYANLFISLFSIFYLLEMIINFI